MLIQYGCPVIASRPEAEQRVSNIRPISPGRPAARFEILDPLPEHALQHLSLDAWIELAIARPLFVRLMADPLVDQPLIDRPAGACGYEAVSQDVVAADHAPFGSCQSPLQMVVGLVLGHGHDPGRLVLADGSQPILHRTGPILPQMPGRPAPPLAPLDMLRLCEQVGLRRDGPSTTRSGLSPERSRAAPDGRPTIVDLLLLADHDVTCREIHIVNPNPEQLALAIAGVGSGRKQRVNPGVFKEREEGVGRQELAAARGVNPEAIHKGIDQVR